VTIDGGRFVFDTANEGLLRGMLPSLVHVASGDTSSWRVRFLLKMNERESLQPGPGSEFGIARLRELILVEILRNRSLRMSHQPAVSVSFIVYCCVRVRRYPASCAESEICVRDRCSVNGTQRVLIAAGSQLTKRR
jgi:hypothetical protein